MERVAEWEAALKRRDFSNVALEAAARADALEAASTEASSMSPRGMEGDGGGPFCGGDACGEEGVSSFSGGGDRIGRTKTTLLAAVLGGRHGETTQERARRRSCKWIVAAQASELNSFFVSIFLGEKNPEINSFSPSLSPPFHHPNDNNKNND